MSLSPTAAADSEGYSGMLERKGALGMWSEKYVTIVGRSMTIADSKGAPGALKVDLINVVRGGSNTIAFRAKGEEIVIRVPGQAEMTEYWWDVAMEGLIAARILEDPHAGLPEEDPRNGLKFVRVPPVYRALFTNLERSIMYWFFPITKFGFMGKLSFKRPTEERLGFLSDKAFYVTRPNSEITRCVKVEKMTSLFTNCGSKKLNGKPPFLVIKMEAPDYDLCFESAEGIMQLVRVIRLLFRTLHHSTQDMKVTSVADFTDPIVNLALDRPSGFDMVMVVPGTKKQLKKRLDVYYAQNKMKPPPPMPRRKPVLPLPPAPKEVDTPSTARPNSPTATATATAAATATATATATADAAKKSPRGKEAEAPPADPAADVPMTDPLGVFLVLTGHPQYYFVLYKQNVDLDLIEYMDETDFKNFGVGNPADIADMQDKVTDEAFMDTVHDTVAKARTDSNWSNKPVTAFAPKSAAPGAPAPAAAPPIRNAITLSSDDESDVVPASPKSQFKIVLDDSDDDLPVASPNKAPLPPIDLDDDDI